MDSDELDFAELVRIEHANATLLSSEGAEEYDRLMYKAKARQRHPRRHASWQWFAWIGGIAACVALLFALNSPAQEPDIADLTYNLQQLINLSPDEDGIINATPIGENVWVEVTHADGTKKTFIMSHDKAMKTTSFLAIY